MTQNKSVKANDFCLRYKRWGIIDNIFSSKKAEEERKQIEAKEKKQLSELRRINAENDRIRQEIEEERNRLQAEKIALEHQKWVASLSDEEKADYERRKKDAAIQRQKEEEEKNRLKKQKEAEEAAALEKRRQEYAKKKELDEQWQIDCAKREKRKKIIIIAISFSILLAFILAVFITLRLNKIKQKKEFEASPNGQALKYIQEKSGGYDDCTFVNTQNSVKLTFKLIYSKNGFSKNDSFSDWVNLNGTNYEASYHYLLFSYIDARPNYNYTECYCNIAFNWDDIAAMQFSINSVISYGSTSKSVIAYHWSSTDGYVRGAECPELLSPKCEIGHFGGSSAFDDEVYTVAWDSVEMGMLFLDSISKEVFGHSLW